MYSTCILQYRNITYFHIIQMRYIKSSNNQYIMEYIAGYTNMFCNIYIDIDVDILHSALQYVFQ